MSIGSDVEPGKKTGLLVSPHGTADGAQLVQDASRDARMGWTPARIYQRTC